MITGMKAPGSSPGFARYSQADLGKVHSFIHSFIRVPGAGSVLCRHYLAGSRQQPRGVATPLISVLQMKKLKHREVKAQRSQS